MGNDALGWHFKCSFGHHDAPKKCYPHIDSEFIEITQTRCMHARAQKPERSVSLAFADANLELFHHHHFLLESVVDNEDQATHRMTLSALLLSAMNRVDSIELQSFHRIQF